MARKPKTIEPGKLASPVVLDGYLRLSAAVLAEGAKAARAGDAGAAAWLANDPAAELMALAIGMDYNPIRRQAAAWQRANVKTSVTICLFV